MSLKRFLIPFVCLSSLSLAPRVLAHSVETNYAMEASKLAITATYSTGEPVPQTPIVVYAPNDPSKPWMIGATDAEGKFAFQPDGQIQGEWEVKIGEGDHSDLLSVPVSAQGVDVEKISKSDGHEGHVHLNPKVAVSKSGVEVVPVAETSQNNPMNYLAIFGAIGLSGGISSALFFWRKRR